MIVSKNKTKVEKMAASWLGDIGSWFSKGDNLEGFGTVVGAAGNIYGGVQQAKAMDQMIALDAHKNSFNESQILKDEEDQRKRQANYDAAQSGIIAL